MQEKKLILYIEEYFKILEEDDSSEPEQVELQEQEKILAKKKKFRNSTISEKSEYGRLYNVA